MVTKPAFNPKYKPGSSQQLVKDLEANFARGTVGKPVQFLPQRKFVEISSFSPNIFGKN